MSKKINHVERKKSRQTNWLLIGIVAVGGLLILFGLLFLSLQVAQAQPLAEYCAENPTSCIFDGAADAPVTIVEVFDYGCTHCRDFAKETFGLLYEAFIATGQVRWISFPYALRSETLPATNASLCANEQGAYFPFTEAMFAQFDAADTLERSGFLRIGNSLGLQMESYTQCIDNGRYNDLIEENMAVARRAGVSATPTFFINGRILEGAYPFETFQQRIENAAGGS